jgi:cytochrome P450
MTEEIEFGGYKIPTEAFVNLQIYALHRNEEYFPEPDLFKPERFLTNEAIGRHAFAFVPFSAGSRNCIGNEIFLLLKGQ